jgi:asparagine synthase (glutamine-hydrolysing)
MCGICGVFRFDGQRVDRESLVSMCNRMRHRGPNGEGYFVSGPFGMGMRRLAIIDVEGGQQPIASEDGRFQVILNGEIYNYLELRKELETAGHLFRTQSDTEVIVHLFEDRGPRSLEALEGMFAFAVWDDLKKELFVCRDRIGIKPLFYASSPSGFVFCSDLSAMRALLPADRVDEQSFLRYLGLGYVPWPNCIIEGVQKLEPGTYLSVGPRRVQKTTYWEPTDTGDLRLRTLAEYKDVLLPVVSGAVRRQMRSDVPVGVFLSGGIDSTAVLGLAAEAGNGRMKSFSIGFEEGANELALARSVAVRFGTEHHSKLLRIEDVYSILQEVTSFLDEPIADNSLVPSYAVSRLAAEHGVPVVLTGAGGDEVFGGYDRYLGRHPVHRALRMLPRSLRSVAGSLYGWINEDLGYRVASEPLDFMLATSGASLSLLRNALANPGDFRAVVGGLIAHFSNGTSGRPRADRRSLMTLDLRSYLVDDVLALTDKMTMAASVEARVPLLDHGLVELCRKIPESVLFHQSTLKALQKELFSFLLPKNVLRGTKMGFSGPTTKWTAEPKLRNAIRRNLAEQPTAFIKEHFRVGRMREVIEQLGRNWYADTTVWSLFIFDLWYRRHLERSYQEVCA